MDDFTLTTGSLARLSGVLPETVRAYGDAGLIPQKKTPAGVRLYPTSAVPAVQRVLAERRRNKGGPRRRKAVAA